MQDAGENSSLAIEDGQMMNISKDFFFDGLVLPVPVFLRMKPHSYLVIGKKSERADFLQLHSFNNPRFGVYVRKQDHPEFIQYISAITEKFVAAPSVPTKIKTRYLQGLLEQALTAIGENGFAPAQQLEKVSNLILGLQKSLPNLDEIIDILMDMPPTDARHSMTVCLVSLTLCDELKLTMPLAREKLVLGSLLHDIGLKFVPRAILDKPLHLWTPDEIQIYEQHPLKGVELVRDLKGITNDILMIIVEHHENSSGTGFPKKIRDVKISPLGKIVIVADFFASLLISPFGQGRNFTPDNAIQYMDDILGQPFNKQVFQALKNIVNKKYLSDKAS